MTLKNREKQDTEGKRQNIITLLGPLDNKQ